MIRKVEYVISYVLHKGEHDEAGSLRTVTKDDEDQARAVISRLRHNRAFFVGTGWGYSKVRITRRVTHLFFEELPPLDADILEELAP